MYAYVSHWPTPIVPMLRQVKIWKTDATRRDTSLLSSYPTVLCFSASAKTPRDDSFNSCRRQNVQCWTASTRGRTSFIPNLILEKNYRKCESSDEIWTAIPPSFLRGRLWCRALITQRPPSLLHQYLNWSSWIGKKRHISLYVTIDAMF